MSPLARRVVRIELVAWRSRAKELIDRQAAVEQRSARIVQVVTMQQPAADLLISIVRPSEPVDRAHVPLRLPGYLYAPTRVHERRTQSSDSVPPS